MKAWLRISALALGLAIFAVGCEQQAQQTQAPPDTRAADEAAIRSADEAWSNVAAAKDAAGFASYYAEDGLVLAPNEERVAGKEAIKKWVDGLMGSPGFSVSWKTDGAGVSKSGELGYSVGTYELTMNDSKGKPQKDKGKYLEVWKKQADGSWKVAADMFNSDLPAQ